MQSIRYKFIELTLIFILIPISYIFDYSPIIKLIIGLLGFIYITYILLKVEKNKLRVSKNIDWKIFLEINTNKTINYSNYYCHFCLANRLKKSFYCSS